MPNYKVKFIAYWEYSRKKPTSFGYQTKYVNEYFVLAVPITARTRRSINKDLVEDKARDIIERNGGKMNWQTKDFEVHEITEVETLKRGEELPDTVYFEGVVKEKVIRDGYNAHIERTIITNRDILRETL